MSTRFDWVVIGGGPGGEKGAVTAAYFGRRVLLVEKQPFLGGACVNTGTLPSKTLRETCLHLSGFKQRGIDSGSAVDIRSLSPERLLERARAVSEAERDRMRVNLERHGVEIVHGSARFVGPNTLDIVTPEGNRRIEGEKFLIATGSTPHRPEGIDFNNPLIDDSDEFLRLNRVPASLVVMGAGVIGCEYATMFAALGARVVLLDPRDAILPFLDREIADRLLAHMRDGLGIDVRLSSGLTSADAGKEGVTCRLSDGSTVEAERLLVAAGRTGTTKDLGLDALGIVPDKRGLLKVDAHYRTAAPHAYAVGDVIGFPALASVAMEQARVAAVHAFNLGTKMGVDPLLPYGIYTIPEVSSIGESEETAKAKGRECEVGRASYASNARGQIIGDRTGLVKLVFRRSDRVLVGCHVIGESASELIHIASMALHSGAAIDAFVEMVFNYPTLADAFKYAAYDGLGRLAGRPGPSSVTRIGG
jgi:NAD(P) transhydrogenase